MAEADLRLLLRTIADTSGADKTSEALRRVQQTTAQTTTSMASMAREAATIGATLGIAIPTAAQAFQISVSFVRDSIDALREHERVSRGVAAGYGELAGAWQNF